MEGNCGGPPAPPLLLCSRSRSASAGPNSWQHRSAGPKKALSCARPAETLAAAAPALMLETGFHIMSSHGGPWGDCIHHFCALEASPFCFFQRMASPLGAMRVGV